MRYALALLLLGGMGASSRPIPIGHADWVELNHYYDAEGNETLTQVVYWKFHGAHGDMHCCGWRMEAGTIHRRIQNGIVDETFRSPRGTRRVIAYGFVESWTKYDPERKDKEFLPPEKRWQMFNEHENVGTSP